MPLTPLSTMLSNKTSGDKIKIVEKGSGSISRFSEVGVHGSLLETKEDRRKKYGQKMRKKFEDSNKKQVGSHRATRKKKARNMKRGRFVCQGLATGKDMNLDSKKIYFAVQSLAKDAAISWSGKTKTVDFVAMVVNKVTNLVSSLHLLRGESDPMRIISILNLSLNAMMPEKAEQVYNMVFSSSTELVSYFKNRFGFVPFQQQSLPEGGDDKEVRWIKELPKVLDNWEAIRHSPAFSKISELISVMATMGMIDHDRLKVTAGGLELFRIGSLRKHANVGDLVSAVLSTIEFFISGGYEFFKTGNPRRFLFEDEESREFNDLYEMLLEATPYVQAFNLAITEVTYRGEKKTITDEEYYVELEKCITLCKKCRSIARNNWLSNYFISRHEKMIQWKADFNSRRCNGKFRKQALSLYLVGESGTGKTTLCPAIRTALLKYMGVKNEELRNVANINECDPFDSTITGSTHCYVYDDIGNTKKEFMKEAPTRKVIDHNNNAPLMANKADLEGKGVTPIRPKLTIYTSNVGIDYIAKTYSNCPESQIRRMIINAELKVKKEFCIPGETRLDGEKVMDKFGLDPFPDAFEITIYMPCKKSQRGLMPILKNGDFDFTNNVGYVFSLQEFMEYCYKVCDKHMKVQDHLQVMDDTIVERCDFCSKCNRPSKFCTCVTEESTKRTDFEVPKELLDDGDDVKIREILDASIEEELANAETRFDTQANPVKKESDFDYVLPPPTDFFDFKEENEVADESLLEELHGDGESSVRLDGFHRMSNYDFDEEESYIVQMRKLSLSSILPFVQPKEQTEIIKARFNDLVDYMEYVPNIVLAYGDFIIARAFRNSTVRRIYWSLWSHRLTKHMRNISIFAFLVDIILVSIMYCAIPFQSIFMFMTAALQAIICTVILVSITKWYNDRMSLLDRLGNSTRHAFLSLKRWHWSKLATYTLSVVTIYYIIRTLKDFHAASTVWKGMFQQGTIHPKNIEDIRKRDSEESDWAKPEVEELHIDNRSKTMTHDQMVNKVSDNLYHVSMVSPDDSDTTNQCDALAVFGNCVLMPMHVFSDKHKRWKVSFRRRAGDMNSVYKGNIALNKAAWIEGIDLVLLPCPFIPPCSDIIHLFPDRLTVKQGGGTFIYRNRDGTLRKDILGFQAEPRYLNGKAYAYQTAINTFNGMCMAVIVGNFSTPCITSCHLLGKADTKNGIGMCIERNLLENLRTIARSKGLIAHSRGELPEKLYGEKLVEAGAPVHENSPLNWLPKESKAIYYGKTSGRISHAKSNVISTKIHDLLNKHLGLENKYGPPKFTRNMWNNSLKYSANPSVGFDVDILEMAAKDKLDGIVKFFQSEGIKEIVDKELRPLQGNEMWDGIDGKRFVDRIPTNTSKGYPVSGPKEEWVKRLEPTETHACPTEIDERVLEEVKRMEDMLARGERCNTIFKACVKDEVTDKSSEKVRVFTASQWAFMILTRKYFLPLARLFSLFPTETETAVGINAHGPEWDELSKFMSKFGDDRILAGDYSKYDLRMPAQTLLRSYEIFIEICRICGHYTEEELFIMGGIATEMCYALVAYNGDLIELCGSHPSGNSMTVYANCMNNSLNMRCAYYQLSIDQGIPVEDIPPFQEICALMCYGDDLKGSVHPKADYFNIISCANYFDAHDIKFTMPDKKSELVKYMNNKDADFLKRKDVYNDRTGLIHGALDINSIWKSLFAVTKSVIGVEAQTSQNLVGALRELFHHGEETFNTYHPKIVAIAEEAGLASYSNVCRDGKTYNPLYDGYEERLAEFKSRYELE